MKNKVRHAKISLAAMVVFVIAYTAVFNDNEDAMSVGGVLALFFCFGLMHFFNEREYRARHPDRDDSD
jgi:hypothetical protein